MSSSLSGALDVLAEVDTQRLRGTGSFSASVVTVATLDAAVLTVFNRPLASSTGFNLYQVTVTLAQCSPMLQMLYNSQVSCELAVYAHAAAKILGNHTYTASRAITLCEWMPTFILT